MNQAFGINVSMPNLAGYIPCSVVRLGSLRVQQQFLSSFRLQPTRSFASSNNVNTQWQALTWIAKQPHQVSPNDITSSYTHFRTSSEQSSLVPILFASPEFTPWIEPTNPLLTQLVTPLFNKIYPVSPPNVVHTVVAVVDRISTNNNDQDVSSGAEGLSLLLADDSSVTATPASLRRTRGSDHEESSFFLSTRGPSVVSNGQTNTHEIGLRLAQTVFRNGRDRTLIGMRWIRDTSSNGYIIDTWQDLSTCSVASSTSEANCSISVPLHPVTERRRVVSSMGNILRQVSKSSAYDGDISAAIPASSELEKELPRYVNELGIPHQRVAVWALVEPSEKASPLDTSSRRDFRRSIQSGSKVHRVVSGGGGWGKKQGLLSLDPEVGFEAISHGVSLDEIFQPQDIDALPSKTTDFPELLNDMGLEENLESLSQVASPGDYIQFFVASESEANMKHKNPSHTTTTLSYSFGVEAPVETEVADLKTASTSSSASPQDLVVIRDHFGALSESAICYSYGSPSDLSSREFNCETKISVPGSRVELFVS